jgi:hypothetical protein
LSLVPVARASMSGFVSRASEKLATLQAQLSRRSQGFADEEAPEIGPSPEIPSERITRANSPDVEEPAQSDSYRKRQFVGLGRTVTFYEPADPDQRGKDGKIAKLGTFEGVFQPVCLNVRSALFRTCLYSRLIFVLPDSCTSRVTMRELTDRPLGKTSRLGIVSYSSVHLSPARLISRHLDPLSSVWLHPRPSRVVGRSPPPLCRLCHRYFHRHERIRHCHEWPSPRYLRRSILSRRTIMRPVQQAVDHTTYCLGAWARSSAGVSVRFWMC